MCAAYNMHHTASASYAVLSSACLCERVWQGLCHAAIADNAVKALVQSSNMTRKTDCSRMLHLINGSCMLAGFQRTSFLGLFLAVYHCAMNTACWGSLAWRGVCAIILHPSVVMTQLHSTGAIWALYYATSGTAILARNVDQVLMLC